MLAETVRLEAPFFTQMTDAKNYEQGGFLSPEKAEHWASRGCGIACLRMVLAHLMPDAPVPTQGALIQEGIALGAYCEKGWIHEGLVRLAANYGIAGIDMRQQTAQELAENVVDEDVCIASVSHGLIAESKGGHLVVVCGMRAHEGRLEGLYVHHPSHIPEMNWKNHFVPVAAFTRCFSGNYIAFS